MGQRLSLFVAEERATDFETLTDLIEAGQLIPGLDRSCPLDQAPEAVRQLERGEVRGKFAITL